MDMVLNLPELRCRLENDEEFIRELLQILLDALPRMAGDIRAAVAAANAEGLTMAAHALKGSAANLAAERVGKIAARLELMGRKQDLTGLRGVHAELEVELGRLVEQLKDILATEPIAA
jgi:HPt (histidine-containing phosphotransfer) domain-containing protein